MPDPPPALGRRLAAALDALQQETVPPDPGEDATTPTLVDAAGYLTAAGLTCVYRAVLGSRPVHPTLARALLQELTALGDARVAGRPR